MHEPWSGIIATDSQSLFNTLAGVTSKDLPVQIPDGSGPHRLDVLSAEWDVVVQIQAQSAFLPGIRLQHIRGHQDDHTPYEQLSLLAQSNVDADHLANRYQRDLGNARPHVLLIPTTGAHLTTPEHLRGHIRSCIIYLNFVCWYI
jgi:hypothetical protein